MKEILYLMNIFLVLAKAQYEQYALFLHLMNLDLVNNPQCSHLSYVQCQSE
jgi:hypothetical protein